MDISKVDQKTYDLSVKNPNKAEEAALRELKEILGEMKDLDKETEVILDKIKKFL